MIFIILQITENIMQSIWVEVYSIVYEWLLCIILHIKYVPHISIYFSYNLSHRIISSIKIFNIFVSLINNNNRLQDFNTRFLI